jgi:hypothetical protein
MEGKAVRSEQRVERSEEGKGEKAFNSRWFDEEMGGWVKYVQMVGGDLKAGWSGSGEVSSCGDF